jgi:hypothetical protein
VKYVFSFAFPSHILIGKMELELFLMVVTFIGDNKKYVFKLVFSTKDIAQKGHSFERNRKK